MDLVGQVLSLTPVPFLAPAWSAFQLIWDSVQQAQASQAQLKALAYAIAQLLRVLNREYDAGNLDVSHTTSSLKMLDR